MKYDVIVCGGGPSGLNAAISARRNGASVLLIESTGLLGGNSVYALVGPWMTFHKNNKQIVKGIAAEMVSRLIEEQACLGHIPDPIGFCETVTPFDQEACKALFFQMVQEEGIDVLLHALVSDVIMNNQTIEGVKVSTKGGKLTYFADVIIDATGDGDVSYLANAPYIHGRNEDHLTQPMTMIFQVANVDTDKIRQAMKEDPQNFVLGKDYDFKYIGVSGFFKEVELAKKNNDFSLPRDRVLLFQEVIPSNVSINMTRVQGLSGVNPLEWSKAEIIARNQIQEAFRFLKKYIPGFENGYIVRTPSQIGVRETRHILCDYLIELDDILQAVSYEDSIALSGFPMDIHSPSGVDLNLNHNELDVSYEIPLRALLPKGIEGLIVSGRCISATHEAQASLRVTPTVMAIGEASGCLAALSVKLNKKPREVDYRLVQQALLDQGQVIKRS